MQIARIKAVRMPQGYTLVELLVGLFLSLFIVAMTITYILTSAKTFTAQTNEALIQENARFAFDQLGQIIRGGGADPSNQMVAGYAPIFTGARCAATANRSNRASDAHPCTLAGLSQGSDRLAIATSVTAGARACDGSDIIVTAEQWRPIATVLWTADFDRDGVRSLYCQSLDLEGGDFIGLATPLVEGVELLQFEVGLDGDQNGALDHYVSASAFPEQDAANVKTIRVALLMSPGSGVQMNKTAERLEERTYRLLDERTVAYTDGIPRSVYSTVVMLPSSRK